VIAKVRNRSHQQSISCISDEIFGAMLTILAVGLICMAKYVTYEAKYERLQVNLMERSLISFFCLFHTDMATVRSGYVARSPFSAVNRQGVANPRQTPEVCDVNPSFRRTSLAVPREIVGQIFKNVEITT
jgi:hypothetical protein